MKLASALLASLALTTPAAPAPPAPRRIVSLNLCADQYLLALADPGQIAALTRLSRDPNISAGAAQAARLPITNGGAEAVLTLRPDLLVVSPGARAATMARLRGPSARTLELPPADSYAAIVAQVREVARAVGHPARGEALIAAMDARLARLPRHVGAGRVAAQYQRRGYLTGTGTLVDELMTRVGLVNLARRLGLPALSTISLERLALARPDLLLVEADSRRVVDRGTEMLQHPILAGIRRISLPQAWTVCGGPAYVLAAERLSGALARPR